MTNTNCQVLEDWPYQSPRSKNFSICCRLSALRMWPWLILDINISRVSQGHSWELGLCIFLENVSIGDETGNWVRFGVKSSWSIGRKWALTQERMSSDGQQEKPFVSSLGNLPHAGAGCQPFQMQWNSPRPSCHVLTLVLWNSHSWVWNAEVEVVSCLSSMTVFDFFFPEAESLMNTEFLQQARLTPSELKESFCLCLASSPECWGINLRFPHLCSKHFPEWVASQVS